MQRALLAAAITAAMTGCASVLNDTTQGIKVETRTASGEPVAGAECRLTNDHGSIKMRSGETTSVRRSNSDLDITCVHPQNADAIARAISRVNGGMFGNILIGGGIGAIIDHNRGTAYTYPTWVQLVFGKTLVFDRQVEDEGKPTPGTEPSEKTAGN
jgi:hypothetical protein